MAQFLIVHLAGGVYDSTRVASAASVAAMHTGGAPSEGFSYAFGWRDGKINGARAVHHGGITPDFNGTMVVLPDSGWGVVVLTNASTGIPTPLMPTSHRLPDDIAAYLAGTPLPLPTSPHGRRWFALALILLAILVKQIRSLWRLKRRPAPGSRTSARLVAAFDLTVGAAMVVVPPRLFGVAWSDMPAIAPDMTLRLLVMATLCVAFAHFSFRLQRDPCLNSAQRRYSDGDQSKGK